MANPAASAPSASTPFHPGPAAPLTHTLGVPRIGARRELKRALESFWRGDSGEGALAETGRALRLDGWRRQREAGVDLVACNDFSLYDRCITRGIAGSILGREGCCCRCRTTLHAGS